MGCDEICFCIGKGLNIGIDWCNYQMYIYDIFDVWMDCGICCWVKCDVWYKVFVYYINVDLICVFSFDCVIFCVKICKIC